VTVLRDGRHVRTLRRDESNPRAVTHLMVGREIEETDVSQPRTPGEVILEVEHLSLPWPGHAKRWRLEDINFTLRRGEVLGIAGLMGAGRTELLECLFGCSPQAPLGRILLGGREVRFNHPAEAKRAGVALVTEDRKRLGLFTQMTVRENVTICTLEKSAAAGLIRRKAECDLAEGAVSQLGIKTAGIENRIANLSGGNQQKCIIGRWLLGEPEVLLLDDPTRGIDVGAKAELYRLIDKLCRRGLAIIVTSSELPELLRLADRIMVLCEGRQTGNFTRREATEQRIMEAATARER
jgi:ABC-type sugar transport system ATPase subunit